MGVDDTRTRVSVGVDDLVFVVVRVTVGSPDVLAVGEAAMDTVDVMVKLADAADVADAVGPAERVSAGVAPAELLVEGAVELLGNDVSDAVGVIVTLLLGLPVPLGDSVPVTEGVPAPEALIVAV